MDCSRIRYSRHAIERMFLRAVPPEVVRAVVVAGETVASYPDDRPFPSVLLLGFHDGLPVHVVAARDPETSVCHVITVYRPAPATWSDDFKTRRET